MGGHPDRTVSPVVGPISFPSRSFARPTQRTATPPQIDHFPVLGGFLSTRREGREGIAVSHARRQGRARVWAICNRPGWWKRGAARKPKHGIAPSHEGDIAGIQPVYGQKQKRQQRQHTRQRQPKQTLGRTAYGGAAPTANRSQRPQSLARQLAAVTQQARSLQLAAGHT